MTAGRSRSSIGSQPLARDAAQVSPTLAPGKHTLTQQLAAPVQRRTTARTTTDGPDVHAAAAHGTGGAATQLPYLDQIQRSFGRHDVGRIQAHVDDRAAEGAGAMGATAFAMGERVAFAGPPDLHTAAHEAAHVVQQRGGVQLKGGVGEVGDTYEQHADQVADRVVRGESSEALLDQHAGQPAGHATAAATASPAVQRYAFVGGKQIKKTDGMAVGAVGAMVTDNLVRSYVSRDELLQHAFGQTDHLGNLDDGTWVRFSPTGLNVLGEMHTNVSLRQVTGAVGTTNFIDERLSNDKLAPGSKVKTAYEAENADSFKEFGVEGKADKQPFGAESLFPKIGFIFSLMLPRLDTANPTRMDKLTHRGDAEDQRWFGANGGYDGQPAQRYLKIAWAYAQDIKAQVATMQAIRHGLPPALTRLAAEVKRVEPQLGGFIPGLPIDGFLGDELEKRENWQRWKPLASFCRAVIDAMVERAIDDPSSRLNDQDKARFARGASDQDKQDMFVNWRNFNFEDSLQDAARRGVRYAGMGANHLAKLRGRLPPGSHPFDMDGPDLQRFKDETRRLRKLARP
jgi:hypothetical protein